MLTVGSLFAGIGGIDLGLERTGHFKTHWFCERDPYCQRVLAKHWPDVPVCEDVANIGADTPAVDVIAAGFPCQPVSHAGRRKAQDDDRWLWPHLERCISVLRPRGVLLENVPGLLTAGFDDVIGGLAACGYDAEWDCIPAAAVGAPHLRDRVFIIATPRAEQPRHLADRDDAGPRDTVRPRWDAPRDGGAPMADADDRRRYGGTGRASRGWEQPENRSGTGGIWGWPSPMANASGAGSQRPGNGWAAANGDCQDGIWAAEPPVGRVANGIPKRVDRLRALGNAVVPQVAECVGWQLVNMMGGTDG
jgi:DNA (cytosine-5)-methyltransferase 1